MYTEIRELANFLARLFHLRVPKRKIGMFCEHLANICLLRFQPYWDVKHPKQNEAKRVIRITRDFADEIITEAATATAVGLQEFANCLPVCLNLYVNPGELFYTTNDNSPPVIIWVGSVNEEHNNEKIHKSSRIPPPRPPSLLSTILPQMPAPIQPLCNLFPSLNMMNSNARANGNGIQFANGYHNQNSGLGDSKMGLIAVVDLVPNMADFTGLDARINLELVHPHELGYALTNPYLDFLIFRFVTQGDPKYTAETFANTRFGYFRNRPDREKDLLDAIKDFVNWDTATTTESITGSGTWSSSSNEGDIWSSSSSPGSSIDRQQQYGNGGTPMV